MINNIRENGQFQGGEQRANGFPRGKAPLSPAIELLRDTGIIKPGQERMVQSQLERQTPHFEWANLATYDTPIGTALNVIQNTDFLSPPRTAHLGGAWTTIAQGGGAELSLNRTIPQEGLGHPLIFDVNQTPDAGNREGDTLYWPGRKFQTDGSSVDLPLYTWNGSAFEKRDREHPFFVPYTVTRNGDGFTPLTRLHKEEMREHGELGFRFLSETIMANEAYVRDLCAKMLKQVENGDDLAFANKIAAGIANRTVTPDGKVYDRALQAAFGGGFRVGENVYSADEVANLLLVPFAVAANPDLLDQPDRIPAHAPLFSKEMIITLMAVLNTHTEPRQDSFKPVNPHFHWGAFQMAGAPPQHKGYFSDSTAELRRLFGMARAVDPDLPPTYYVLLPAAPFTLWPHEGHPNDIEATNELIGNIRAKTENFARKNQQMADGVEAVTREWLTKYGAHLSPYFLSRFSKKPDSSLSSALPISPKAVKPEGFDGLTFRQASMTIGALKSLLN